jgi:haloacetate dehalogenase
LVRALPGAALAPVLSGLSFTDCAGARAAVVHGMCEDYRAGLRADRAHEEADRTAGRKVQCPMLLLVSTNDDLDIHGDPEAIWLPWTAGGLRSRCIHSGHHQAEEAPDQLAMALLDFLGRPIPGQAGSA